MSKLSETEKIGLWEQAGNDLINLHGILIDKKRENENGPFFRKERLNN